MRSFHSVYTLTDKCAHTGSDMDLAYLCSFYFFIFSFVRVHTDRHTPHGQRHGPDLHMTDISNSFFLFFLFPFCRCTHADRQCVHCFFACFFFCLFVPLCCEQRHGPGLHDGHFQLRVARFRLSFPVVYSERERILSKRTIL